MRGTRTGSDCRGRTVVQRRPPVSPRSTRDGPSAATTARAGRQREAAASCGQRTTTSRSTMRTRLHEIGRAATDCEGDWRASWRCRLDLWMMVHLKQRTSQEQRVQRGPGGGGGRRGLRDLAAMGWTPWLEVPLYIGGRFIQPQSSAILSYSNLTLLKEDTGRIAEQTLRGGGRCVAGRGEDYQRKRPGGEEEGGRRSS